MAAKVAPEALHDVKVNGRNKGGVASDVDTVSRARKSIKDFRKNSVHGLESYPGAPGVAANESEERKLQNWKAVQDAEFPHIRYLAKARLSDEERKTRPFVIVCSYAGARWR